MKHVYFYLPLVIKHWESPLKVKCSNVRNVNNSFFPFFSLIDEEKSKFLILGSELILIPVDMSATPLHKRPYNLLAHLRKEGRCKLKSFGAQKHRLEAIFIPRPFIILSGHLTVVHPSIYLFWGVTALLLDYQNGAVAYAWLR